MTEESSRIIDLSYEERLLLSYLLIHPGGYTTVGFFPDDLKVGIDPDNRQAFEERRIKIWEILMSFCKKGFVRKERRSPGYSPSYDTYILDISLEPKAQEKTRYQEKYPDLFIPQEIRDKYREVKENG